jgi:protein SCO2
VWLKVLLTRNGATRSGTLIKGHTLWRMAMKDVCLAIIATIMMALSGVAVAGDQSAGMGGPFALIDQNGHHLTDADFRGKLMLIYFGYTFCPDACPTTLFAIGQAMVRLTPDERKRVAPIFITSTRSATRRKCWPTT